MQALLSFDQAPPYSVPVRFMLTAPLFGIAAGLLLLFAGPDVLASRWSPLTLALTHLFTAGFLLQAMLGALFQIMPVAVGANIARPLWLARIVHVATTSGTLCLVIGFLSGRLVFMHAAGALLGLGIACFVGGAARALWRVPNSNATGAAIKLALIGLAITSALGLTLLAAWVGGHAWPVQVMTDLHAAWGLLGWCAVLLAGVAYVVVPMFQLTPGYSARFMRWYAPALIAAMLVWTVMRWLDAGVGAAAAQLLVGAVAAAFALTTIGLQRRSKRTRADATMRYWRLGLGAAIAAAFLLLATTLADPASDWAPAAFLIAALAIGGALVSVVSGMLYKILPFLSWLHLQNAAGAVRGIKVPHMGEYLPERFMHRQFYAHVATVVLFVLAILVPDLLARAAGLALLVSNAMLLTNLVRVLRRYRGVRADITALAAA